MTKKNIPLFKVFMSPEAKEVVGTVLDSGYIGQGPKVEEFEQALKNRFNYDRIVSVNSATSALHLALHMLKAPHNTGQYATIKDLILAERRVGLDAQFIDFGYEKIRSNNNCI